MFPSLRLVSQRITSTTIRLASSSTSTAATSSSTTSIPSLQSHKKAATPTQIDQAKQLLTSPTLPRSQQHKSRLYPSFRGLPTNEKYATRQPTTTPDGKTLYPSKTRYDTGVTPEQMPYLHHMNHDEKPKPKFKNPRKRASKLFHELTTEAALKSQQSKPEVWNVPFKVGDAVELEVLDSGGVHNPTNKRYDKIRGVVLGRENKGLDTSIYLKDVLFGEHVERKVKLHSPMVKTLKVLEEGFVNRGKKKGRRVKRAKLYYLRDRKPEETRVTKIQK